MAVKPRDPGEETVIVSLSDHIVQLLSKHLCSHQCRSQPGVEKLPFLHRVIVKADTVYLIKVLRISD